MKRKRADRKREILQEVSRCVQQFYPELIDIFICPTCLDQKPIHDPEEITEAHIVPRAAGGGLTTLLCRRCNSAYGSIQDKWFGEYLRLLRMPRLRIFHTKRRHQQGYFEVAGHRMNGRYQVSPNGGIEFLVVKQERSSAATDSESGSTAASQEHQCSLYEPVV